LRRHHTRLSLAAGAIAYPFFEARSPRLRRYQLRTNPGQVASLVLEDSAPNCAIRIDRREENRRAASNSPNISSASLRWQLRILHLSDLHLWSGTSWLADWVASLAEFQDIDFVVLTGDNFADASGLRMLSRALNPLLKLPGAFVFGSNDYYSGIPKVPLHYFLPNKKPKLRTVPDLPTEDFRDFLTARGWSDLNNQVATCTLTSPARQGHSAKKLTVALTGTDDPHIGRDQAVQVPDTWGKADLRLPHPCPLCARPRPICSLPSRPGAGRTYPRRSGVSTGIWGSSKQHRSAAELLGRDAFMAYRHGS